MLASVALALVLAAHAPATDVQSPSSPRIEIGESRTGRLEPALAGSPARVAFALRAAEAGPATIRLESYDFDAVVELVRPDGTRVAGAGDGGLGSDARLAVELEAGAEYRAVASSADGRGGEFTLSIDRLPPPLPRGAEWLAAQIAYWTTCHERARERGDARRQLIGLRLAGQFAYHLGRLSFALDCFQQALALAEPDAALLADARFARAWVGALLLERGDFGQAQGHLEQALTELQAHDDPHLRSFVLQALGDLHVGRSELDAAEARFLEGLAAAEASDLGVQEAAALARLGHLRSLRGEDAEALLLCAEAVEIGKAFGPDQEVRARRVQADSLRLAGEPDRARVELERVLELSGTGEQRALALEQLGELDRLEGHYQAAHARFAEALEVSDEIDHELLPARILVSLARLARSVADDAGARRAIEQALERTQDPFRVGQRIDVLNELALLQGELGALDERRFRHEEALALAKSEGLRDYEIRTRINLGQLHEVLGELDTARSVQLEALALAEHERAPVLTALAEVNLGYVELLRGAPELAQRLSDQALERLARVGLVEESLAPLDTIARAAIALGDSERAVEAVASVRSILERRSGALSRAEAAGWRSRHAWWAETLPQDLALMRVGRAAQGSPEHNGAIRDGFLAAGEWKGRALSAGIADRRPTGASRPDLFAALGRELEPDVLLLEYASASDRLVAYSVRGSAVSFHDLGQRDAIERRVQAFVRCLSEPSELGDAETILALGAWLYDVLLRPVMDAHPGTERLAIVPTDALVALPFDALVVGVDPQSSRPRLEDLVFLLDRCRVTYAPSTAVLVELASLGPGREPGRVLVLADPIYPIELASDRDGGRRAPDPRVFDRLQATRDEAFTLSRLLLRDDLAESYGSALLGLLDDRSGTLETPAFTLCLGAEATPGRLRGNLGQFDVIHCAAHGYVDGDDPQNTGLALSFTAEDSGFLSLGDVLELEIDGSLAVLSACETARGRILRGEGVQSLANAFLRAGARSVVASLWKVRDLETAEIMKRFYELHIGADVTAADALREAKRSQRNARIERGRSVAEDKVPPALAPGHPYYWAAYVYVGPPSPRR